MFKSRQGVLGRVRTRGHLGTAPRVLKAALPVASADPGVSRVVESRVRQVAVFVLLVGALATAPGSLLATLMREPSPPAVSELQSLRERAERREALARTLEGQVGTLDAEIDALKITRGEHAAGFRLARQRLDVLEQTLDHLVPRLLAREVVIEARRAQATQALARLANASREVDIAPELRARLLAVSPMMLERLRGAEASVADLREEEREGSAEYRRLLAQAPALLEARQRAEMLREQAERRRGAIQNHLVGLRAEIAELEAEQAQIARRLIGREAAVLARAEPQADETTMAEMRAEGVLHRLPEVTVKGAIAGDLVVSETVGRAQVAGAPPRSRMAKSNPTLSAAADVRTLIGPPPAKPRGIDTPAAVSVTSGVATVSAPASAEADPTIRSRLSALVAAARLDAPGTSLMPVPGEVIAGGQVRVAQGGDGSSLVIEAKAGQVVVAPDQGQVVFAGRFKRYGLLLMIEHSPDYHTLLWGFADLRVKRGQHVRAGQIVGSLGSSRGIPPSLHMEIRRNGEPVNPLLWMAASNSKVQG